MSQSSKSLRITSRSEPAQATHEQSIVEIPSSPISLQKTPEQPTVVPPVQYSTLPISHSQHETVQLSSQSPDILFEEAISEDLGFDDTLDFDDAHEPSSPTQMVGTLLLQSS